MVYEKINDGIGVPSKSGDAGRKLILGLGFRVKGFGLRVQGAGFMA